MDSDKTYRLAEKILGRQRLWRIGRWLYLGARRESTNTPSSNGEYDLVGWYVSAHAKSQGTLHFFDIGAMHADWSVEVSRVCAKKEKNVAITAFEASPTQVDRISARLIDDNLNSIKLDPVAISDHCGDAQFLVTGEDTGSSSLVDNSTSRMGKTIDVKVSTLDAKVQEFNLSNLDIVKVDTEGNDFKVIRGAVQSLRDGNIGVIQFEYNWHWLRFGYSLRDVFDIIEDLPYEFGKLTQDGIEIYSEWNMELDRFIETNYLLIRPDIIENLPCKDYVFDKHNTAVQKVPKI